ANGSRACAGCHDPKKGFADGLPRALETDGHSSLARNTPTLWNAALQRKQFADSRQPSLHHLVLEVLGNSREMNTSADSAVARIIDKPEYILLYRDAFPENTGTMKTKDLVSSMAMFVHTLISYNSRFDQYMRGKNNALSKQELRGFNLFMGKGKCATCHFIPFTNGSKPPNWYYQDSEVIGVPATADTVNATIDPDPGRYANIQKDFLRHSFKTPSLRNISLTGPYMHNGVFETLEQVIDFYDRGGGAGLGIDLPNQSLPPEKLGLSKAEKQQLLAFLSSLNDEN
ncbi:MAG: cytochrome C peroxidase, partial [Gemmatimonadaceae bacterium]|nr:cytochrome C peroxidase [Chitinophagaceae bacterium]